MNRYLITGVSSDVGMEYIRMLEEKGEDCLVYGQYYNNGEPLIGLEKILDHVRLKVKQCDLNDLDQTVKWIGGIVDEGVIPTRILHLAAIPLQYTKLKNFEWQDFEKDFNVQVRSLVFIMKTFLPGMARVRHGRMAVILSSCTLGTPPRYMSGYVMAKYALWGLVRSAAVEYGDKGICVNGISPGMMETKFLKNIDGRIAEMTAQDSMLKRNITVKETCAAIDYLFSEKAACINGINLNISGGTYM